MPSGISISSSTNILTINGSAIAWTERHFLENFKITAKYTIYDKTFTKTK